MRAGSERAPGVDHDRSRVGRRVMPRRTDPEGPDPDRMVERFPPVTPVSRDVLPAHASERVPETFLATGARVRDALDPVRSVDRLDATAKALEHLRACFV